MSEPLVKNYYEILGVAPHVGSGQIQAAYRFTRSLYFGDSTPTYGFLDADEKTRMLALVEEAYAALSNPSVRRDYDQRLGNATAGGHGAHGPPTVAPAAPRRHDLKPTPLPAPPETQTPLKVPEVVNGSVLRTLREARGLSVDQIAALSKVGGRFLTALEEDRHSALPGRVFARGFLIEYARAIGVNESELVERYLRHWPA